MDIPDYNRKLAHRDGRHTFCRPSQCAETATWWWLENDETPREHLDRSTS